MFTFALIGGDGAGKTTVANEILKSSRLPIKYLYMGVSTRSSNHALPTSRLVLFIKKRLYKKKVQHSAEPLPEEIPADQLEYSEETHGWLWNTARFLNRLAEAWYRQFISLNYRLRGNIVLYDRHFFFDSAPGVINADEQKLMLLDQLFFWLMSHFYPRPNITIFLDAPPELLYKRKGEATPEYLEQQRGVFLAQGKKLAYFIRVDASQPLEKVCGEVIHHLQEFYSLRHPRHAGISQPDNINRN